MSSGSTIRFGVYEIDRGSWELRKGGRKLPLSPQGVKLLAVLAESPGKVVSREVIERRLWGATTFVGFEQSVNFIISRIRAILGDSAKKPRFVETLPGRGYRFLFPIDQPESESEDLRAFEHYDQARKSFEKFGMGGLEDAIAEFSKAVRIRTEYAMAHSGLGAAYALRNIFKRDPKDLKEAQTHLERAVDLDRELAEPWPWLCYVYIHRYNLPRAIDAGTKAVELLPDLVQAQYFLGLAYFCSTETGVATHYGAAAKHLQRAIVVNPAWQASWFVLASICALNGLYKEAEQYASRLVLTEVPPPGLAFIGGELLLATIAGRTGKEQVARELATEFFRRAQSVDHMYRDSMRALTACTLGEIELRTGNLRQASVAFRSAWQLLHEHPRMLTHYRIQVRVLAGFASYYSAAGEQQEATNKLAEALAAVDQIEITRQAGAGAHLGEILYSVAVACVKTGSNRALDLLEQAVARGWHDAHWLKRDPELIPVRGESRFVAIVSECERLALQGLADD